MFTMSSTAPTERFSPENESASASTPMMAQYLATKAKHPDELLFYRMGDFYEMFFEDARKAAGALQIALTKRGRHDGQDIPMCGVPVHAADAYLQRLIRQGFRVAICEQMEDPVAAKKRGAKAVRREVVRVVTPGTLTEDTQLDARAHNFLASVARAEGGLGLAWADISTGDLFAAPVGAGGLAADLARLDPSEILVPDTMLADEALLDRNDGLTPLPASRVSSQVGERRLCALFGVASLDGFGAFSRAETAALGALVEYVELTQVGKLPRLKPPRREDLGSVMAIDPATRRNLELVETLAGEREGSLLAAVDRTVTGAGARLLAERLKAPLTDPVAIDARLDEVEFFAADGPARQAAREALGAAPDIERALGRLSVGRGGPRDLAALGAGLAAAGAVRDRLRGAGALPPALAATLADIGAHGALVETLARALRSELPLLARDGHFVAAGYRADLDEQRTLRDESRRLIAGLEARYREETGIASLKIKHNNVLGWFIEVTALHADKLVGSFVHRQTLAGAGRFSSKDLAELEVAIGRAADRALAIELEVFDELARAVLADAPAIERTASALARLDVAAALAELAVAERWSRPTVDASTLFQVSGGRHPVVERALKAASAAPFVANDCDLAPECRVWLVTGPNMAGKSTFLRQNALIAMLAQAGSYVPADKVHIGAVDRLFSRVGAADDLARGRSTFMVEMVETAAILNQAGPRALVILDEIGRGTATFDGLSIAWATVENLHEVNKCRALFATHYHELVGLAARLSALRPVTMKVKEWKGDVVFLHEVVPGAADRSYGIQVAKLAGLPPAVIARALEVLKALEVGNKADAAARLSEDLPLFAARPAGQEAAKAAMSSPIEEALRKLHPDELTPRAALELVYRLKSLLDETSDRS
jgi:DNA mismatch repair protein MutS